MDIINKVIEFYCNEELESFKTSKYCLGLSNRSTQSGFCFKCGVGPSINSKPDKIKELYLYFDVVDNNNKIVEFNEYPFSFSTAIIHFYRKEVIKFTHWEEDEDFIDSIAHILNEFKNINI